MTTTNESALPHTDLEEVVKVVADYCEGYYRRVPDQTHRAYHPECLKRSFQRTEDDVFYLLVQTRASMVDVSRISGRAEEPKYEIFVDDITGRIATARLYSNAWVDYLHVVKARGRWGLLHAAYTELPEDGGTPDAAVLAEIESVATDYVAGWYLADAERHLRAYHEECVKRAFTDTDGMAIYSGTAMAAAAGERTPDPSAEWAITIDDVCADVATVRIDSRDFVDHLHIARARGRWGLFHGSFHVKAGS